MNTRSLKNQLIKLDNNNEYLNSIKNEYNGELYKFHKSIYILFQNNNKYILKNIENNKEYIASSSNELELLLEHFKSMIEKDLIG